MRAKPSKRKANKSGLNLHDAHRKRQPKVRRERDVSLPVRGLPMFVYGMRPSIVIAVGASPLRVDKLSFPMLPFAPSGRAAVMRNW